MPYVDRHGTVRQGDRPSSRPMLTETQRTLAVLVAVLVLPSLALRSWRQMRAEEGVDLSRLSISTTPFDTPSIDKLDNTVRIEYCAS
mmetsp:Transcript_9386/g.29630  ORF Transcript_9386/g.29630 Transcript_9386/m.29630 type:complete len:87 (-) Transcript_9386:766-1026(-)